MIVLSKSVHVIGQTACVSGADVSNEKLSSVSETDSQTNWLSVLLSSIDPQVASLTPYSVEDVGVYCTRQII